MRHSLCSAVNAWLQRLPPQRVGSSGRFVSRGGSCLELYLRRLQQAARAETDLFWQFLDLWIRNLGMTSCVLCFRNSHKAAH